MAAAEHARIIGTRNPCGLFVRLVRGGLLHFATYDDETAASVRLRRHLYGSAPPERSAEQGMAMSGRVPELSDDARLVQAVRAAAGPGGLPWRCLPAAETRRSRNGRASAGTGRWRSWAGETGAMSPSPGIPHDRFRRPDRRYDPAPAAFSGLCGGPEPP